MIAPISAGEETINKINQSFVNWQEMGCPPVYGGDADLLAPCIRKEFWKESAKRESAVLIPLIVSREGVDVLFMQRSSRGSYPGAICFPGGRPEPQDNGDLTATALREMEEETGISKNLVEVIGEMPIYNVRRGYCVTPVIGAIRSPVNLAVNKLEVAQTFHMPLSHALSDKSYEVAEPTRDKLPVDNDLKDYQLHFLAVKFNSHTVWGITAGILRGFKDIVSPRNNQLVLSLNPHRS